MVIKRKYREIQRQLSRKLSYFDITDTLVLFFDQNLKISLQNSTKKRDKYLGKQI